jgi:predicted nuclease with TOPRIM domain
LIRVHGDSRDVKINLLRMKDDLDERQKELNDYLSKYNEL